MFDGERNDGQQISIFNYSPNFWAQRFTCFLDILFECLTACQIQSILSQAIIFHSFLPFSQLLHPYFNTIIFSFIPDPLIHFLASGRMYPQNSQLTLPCSQRRYNFICICNKDINLNFISYYCLTKWTMYAYSGCPKISASKSRTAVSFA